MFGIRPWFWGDTATAALAIALIWLLVFFTRGRSFAAIGGAMFASLAFIAVVPDFGTALINPGYGDYGSRMELVALSCLAGAGIGALGGALRVAIVRSENEPLATRPHYPGRHLGRWLVAWIVAGSLCGMTIAAFNVESYKSWLAVQAFCAAVMLLVGLLTAEPVRRSARLAAIVDCFLVSLLSAGIGGISMVVVGKITWPIFADVAVRSSDAQWAKTLKVFIGCGSGAGALLGVFCWVALQALTNGGSAPGQPAARHQ
jgi:hypothetical protein